MGINELKLQDARQHFTAASNVTDHSFNALNIWSNFKAFVFEGTTHHESFKNSCFVTRCVVAVVGAVPAGLASIFVSWTPVARLFTKDSNPLFVVRDQAIRDVAANAMNARAEGKTLADAPKVSKMSAKARDSVNVYAKKVAESFSNAKQVQDIAVYVKAGFEDAAQSPEYKTLAPEEQKAFREAFAVAIRKEVAKHIAAKHIEGKNALELKASFGKDTIGDALLGISRYITQVLDVDQPAPDQTIAAQVTTILRKPGAITVETKKETLKQLQREIDRANQSGKELNPDFANEVAELKAAQKAKNDVWNNDYRTFKAKVGNERNKILREIKANLTQDEEFVSQDGARAGHWLTKSDVEALIDSRKTKLEAKIQRRTEKQEALTARIQELKDRRDSGSRAAVTTKKAELAALKNEIKTLKRTQKSNDKAFDKLLTKLEKFDDKYEFDSKSQELLDLKKERVVLQKKLEELNVTGSVDTAAKAQLRGLLTEVHTMYNESTARAVARPVRLAADMTTEQLLEARGRAFLNGDLTASSSTTPATPATPAASTTPATPAAAPVAPAALDLTVTRAQLEAMPVDQLQARFELAIAQSPLLTSQAVTARECFRLFVTERAVHAWDRQYTADAAAGNPLPTPATYTQADMPEVPLVHLDDLSRLPYPTLAEFTARVNAADNPELDLAGNVISPARPLSDDTLDEARSNYEDTVHEYLTLDRAVSETCLVASLRGLTAVVDPDDRSVASDSDSDSDRSVSDSGSDRSDVSSVRSDESDRGDRPLRRRSRRPAAAGGTPATAPATTTSRRRRRRR